MNLNSTRKWLMNLVALAAIFSFSLHASAQTISCQNERVIWLETFGQGTTVTSHPDVINITFDNTGDELWHEGTYRVINNTGQKPDWHHKPDHTGDLDGKMLVVNGQAEQFFQKVLTDASGFADGVYSVSMYVMNVNYVGVCAPDPLLPVMQIIVEYRDGSGNWVPLGNSPVTHAPIPQDIYAPWINVGGYFQLPSLGTFTPTEIRITIGDGTEGGCGNDFAVDDIKFAQCPEGGPTPVTFTNVSAKQKGSGISVDWGTSQEINNDRFEVERSSDGSNGWQKVATVAGAGNSQVAHSYSAFDANPASGTNYYRVKQVDFDGKSAYSKIVSARNDNNAVRVAVMGNPFRNNFVVKFSGAAQEVNARLVDITGKQMARETWTVPGGETSKQFNNISGLQNGIYILTIQSKSGEVLYNGKVMKQ